MFFSTVFKARRRKKTLLTHRFYEKELNILLKFWNKTHENETHIVWNSLEIQMYIRNKKWSMQDTSNPMFYFFQSGTHVQWRQFIILLIFDYFSLQLKVLPIASSTDQRAWLKLWENHYAISMIFAKHCMAITKS